MKKSLLFLFVSFAFMGVAGDAFAGNADVIFDILASKGGTIGKGLRDTGFLIAGFGLIVFSFMAIFNKISWKMLAYIMFSTFVLSTMIGIIGYISGGQSGQPFPDIQSTGAGGESMDPTQAQVGKEGGSPQYGNGTAPYKLETVDTSGSAQQYAAQNQAALDQRVESYMQNGQQQQQQEQQQEQEQNTYSADNSNISMPKLTDNEGYSLLDKQVIKKMQKVDPDVFKGDTFGQPTQVDVAKLSDKELKEEIKKNKDGAGWMNYYLNEVVWSPPLSDEQKTTMEQLKEYYEAKKNVAESEKDSRKKSKKK